MALNDISTLPNKNDRKVAKILLAQTKRQQTGTVGFRRLNIYEGTHSPVLGRPWRAA